MFAAGRISLVATNRGWRMRDRLEGVADPPRCGSRQTPDLCRVQLQQCCRAIDTHVLADKKAHRVCQRVRRLTQRPLGSLAGVQRDERVRRCLLDSLVLFVAGFVQLSAASPGLANAVACLLAYLVVTATSLLVPFRLRIVTRTSATRS
jgi:hypothetical protein